MKPVKFPAANVVIGRHQPEYLPLPALVVQGTVISCWAATWRERLRFLLTGRLWLAQLTFGDLFQPQMPSVTQPAVSRR